MPSPVSRIEPMNMGAFFTKIRTYIDLPPETGKIIMP
jgi:hypothetical protein